MDSIILAAVSTFSPLSAFTFGFNKLHIKSCEAVVDGQSGEKVTNLDDLQDIDELHVIEVGHAHTPGAFI